jgi:hypothetical protein
VPRRSLKEKGLQHTEEGLKVINLILGQMNNNRLSTNLRSTCKHEPEQLYLEIDKRAARCERARPPSLLNRPSNYEVMEDGRLFIKSLNKFNNSGIKMQVEIKDKNGLVLYTSESILACAKFLGKSKSTVTRRLNDSKPIF